ncbi:MAG: drug resistance transporter, EmrB/QacA subfamily [Actinomycetia bacterium]|nr:drug resistance transporter, EmrB/QacA subfamily [Actinomycetes bacterium]
MPPHDTVASAPATHGLYDRRWWALAVLCLSLLIVFVGNSSLNVAIPTLSRELHATESQLQWVVAIYSLVFAGLLFTTGALGDRFGRKGALQIGLVLFLFGALLATASTSMWQLIGSRAVMGAAAALIMPSTLSIIINIFPPHERPKAIAVWASITGAAGALGPVASGFLLGHFWYGSVFLVNVPIIVVALISGKFLVPKSRDPEEARLDPLGVILSIVGIVALVYGLIEAPDKGWSSVETLSALGIAVIVLALFFAWELRADEPMLDMHFFRNPAFSTGTGGMILVFVAMYGVMFLISQYFQLVLGYSALSTALRLLPIALIMVVVAPFTPRLSARFGAHRTVAVGMLSIATGLALFNGLSPHTTYAYVVLCVIPLTTGIALSMSPMTASIMSAVPSRRAGAGSAMNDATRELGAALGIAVLGSVAASQYAAKIAPFLRSLSPADQSAARTSIAGALRVASTLPQPAQRVLTGAADHAFVGGIHFAVTVGAILALISAGIVLRYMPHSLLAEGAMRGPIESLEDAAELGIAGLPPIFSDEANDEERSA